MIYDWQSPTLYEKVPFVHGPPQYLLERWEHLGLVWRGPPAYDDEEES